MVSIQWEVRVACRGERSIFRLTFFFISVQVVYFAFAYLLVISKIIAPVILKRAVIPVILFRTQESEERVEASVQRCILLSEISKMPL